MLKVTTCDVKQELKVLFGLSKVIGMVAWWTYASTQAKKVNIRKGNSKHPNDSISSLSWFFIISLNPYLFTKAWSFTSLLFACHCVAYKMPWKQKHKNFKLVLFCSCPSHGKEKRKFSQPFMMLRSSIESWKGFFFPLYDSWLLLQLIC